MEKSNLLYKKTTFGKIPDGWEVVNLDKYINIETGKRSKGGGLREGEVASIGGEHISESGKVEWEDMKFITSKFYNKLKQGKVRKGDILIVKDGATTGKTALINEFFYPNVAVNEHVFIIRSKLKDKLFDPFLFYILFSRIGRIQIKQRTHGIIGGIKRSDFKLIIIPLPPLPEQEKIAEILGTVDKATLKVDKAIEKTERLKKGLMQELLTKGIGHKEFKDTKIGRIPKEWIVVKLKNLVNEDSDIVAGPFGSNLKVSDYRSEGIPIIRLQNIERNKFINQDIKYTSHEKAKELQYHSYQSGDLVLAKLGDPIGKTCAVPDYMEKGIVVADVVRIRLSIKKAVNDFIEYMLNSYVCYRQLRKETIGSTRPRVNISQVRNLNLPRPPLQEQKKIAEILSTVDEKIELEKEKKGKLQRINRGLMQGLLTGRKRVKV